jgi:hypothetical protein
MLTITLMMRLLFYGMHYLLTDIKMYSEYLLLQEHNEIYFSIPYKTCYVSVCCLNARYQVHNVYYICNTYNLLTFVLLYLFSFFEEV